MNNKILSLIFFALLGLLIAKKTFLKSNTRSFKQELTSFAADKIDKLTIQVGEASMTTVTKEGQQWKATNGTKTVDAKESAVKAIINELGALKTKQLVSRSSDKWEEYEVDDTKAKKIKLYSGGKEVAALHVGRFNFNQQTRTGLSYARLSNEDEIYALDGFLAMSVAKDFNSFRETKLASLDVASIEQVRLQKPSGAMTLSKGLDGMWIKDGAQVDSTAAVRYISALNNINGTNINDDFSEASSIASQTLEVGTTTITAFLRTEGGFVIKSSENPAYFDSDSSGVFKKVFLDFEEMK